MAGDSAAGVVAVGGFSGLGWGPASWCFGTPYYSWGGYADYFNPYASSLVLAADQPLLVAANGAAGVFDYTQPIAVDGQAPEADEADQALAIFDQARAAFKQNQFDQALQLADSSLLILPQDATLHEFRALCLFALGPVRRRGRGHLRRAGRRPGLGLATLIGLYPDVTPTPPSSATWRTRPGRTPTSPHPASSSPTTT